MKNKCTKIACIIIFILMISGCNLFGNKNSRSGISQNGSYTHISMEEAKTIIASEKDLIIVDVRRPDEFAEGHIPNAVNIPNEIIGNESPEVLAKKEQLILIYCRSGARAKNAAEKLAAMGYTNIKEFGGINSWNGEIVK